MSSIIVPKLLTVGTIADELGLSLARVQYILAARRHIRPVARAGALRLFDEKALAQIRYESNRIDARRHRNTEGGNVG
jgi:hypothetical protein